MAPLVSPVSNANIRADDNLQIQVLELMKSLQEKVKILKTNLKNTTTKNSPCKRKKRQ